MAEQSVVDAPEFEFAGDGDDSAAEAGGDAGSGQGQSKSSRRRRRKRRNKIASQGGVVIEGGSGGGDFDSAEDASSGGASGASSATSQISPMEGESLAAAASPAPRRQQSSQSAAANGQPASGQQAQANGQPQGDGKGKRWKKKFRESGRERRPQRSENPGNDFRADNTGRQIFASGGGNADNFGNGSGFKRKGKGGGQQRKDRTFVGPMDHSYREANGNYADTPPSTIPTHPGQRSGGRRHHGDSQPIDHSMPRAVPVPENAQTHIYFFIEDLFITAKVQEAAKKQGVKIGFVKNEKEPLAELMAEKETDKPSLIVFDLNNTTAKPLTLIPKLKTKFKRSVSIIGFLSHLQGDLKAKAVEAGCDVVMPRAAFSQGLPNLLRRYGVEEDEEVNFNR
jgi:hypothetical protein